MNYVIATTTVIGRFKVPVLSVGALIGCVLLWSLVPRVPAFVAGAFGKAAEPSGWGFYLALAGVIIPLAALFSRDPMVLRKD